VGNKFASTLTGVRGQMPLGMDNTFQGQLKESGIPQSRTVDFQFALFDDEVGGAQAGSTLSRDSVDLVDGLFAVSLDFDAAAFNGEAR